MAKESGSASFKPSSAVKGGGLIQGDLVWRNPRFQMYDYNGKSPESPCFAIDLEPEEGDKITQYYSCGSAKEWAPSKDGNKLVPLGSAKGIVDSTNFMILMKSLVDAGFKEDDMSSEAKDYEGLKCHMIRIPAPERTGLKSPPKDSKYEKDILVVDKILSLPGESGKGGGKSESSGEIEGIAQGAILEILGGESKPLNRMKLAGALFTKLKKEGIEQGKINAAVQLVGGKDESFLENGPWTYKKGDLSMG